MFTIHRSRSVFLGSAAFLALALFAPGAVNADDAIPLIAPVTGPSTDAIPVMAPVAGPSWDETSGYGAVEASRATIGHPAAGTTFEQTRMAVAQRALLTGDIGGMQEEHLFAIVAAAPVAAPSWDETSGYGAVEASRAANALPAAPAASTTAEETRALTAQRALQTYDLGSLQEEALLAVVATGSSWDQTSGYGSVEASRATIGHPATSTTDESALLAQFRAVELALSRSLGAD
jgi:hypothetical protein